MAKYNGSIFLSVNLAQRTNLQRKILKDIDSPKIRAGMSKIILEYVEQSNVIPKKSGELRRSRYYNQHGFGWRTPYAHYQYMGEVYGPNFIGYMSDGSVGWKSPKPKHPTGRELGVPGTAELKPRFGLDISRARINWTFGYTTPGTTHHWFDRVWEQKSGAIQNKITRYLKQEAWGK